jgi:phosphoserine phosphatase
MPQFNLIVQGEEVATPDLKELYRLSSASAIERVADQAFKLPNADIARKAAVATFCAQAQIDFGFVEAGRKLDDFGLIAMDMDSTLITIECVDEIADFVGRKAEVAAVTASAMRGDIDWPQSLRRRVALLQGLDEAALQRVYDERLQLSPGAETLLLAAQRHGIKLLLVSGGFTFFTERLKQRLEIDFAYANVLAVEGGKLTGEVVGELTDADAKARHVARLKHELKLSPEQVMVLGDGANDLKMMAEAGTSVAYRAKPVVQQHATYALNHSGLDAVLNLFPA